MRWVTRKPPNMFTAANTSATKPSTRAMQRRRHRPHHVVADENGEHEYREAEHERIDRAGGCVVRGNRRRIRIGLSHVSGPLQLLGSGTGEVHGFLVTEFGHSWIFLRRRFSVENSDGPRRRRGSAPSP